MVLERHRGRPQLTRCLSPEFQAGSPKATVQASGFTRILELGGVFRRGALRTSSYALVAKVRLRVLGGGFMPVNKRSSLFAILARSLQL